MTQRELAQARRYAKTMGFSVRTIRGHGVRHYQLMEPLTEVVVADFLLTAGDVLYVCEQITQHAPRH